MTSLDEMKMARDGWLAYGQRPRAAIAPVFQFKAWLPNGNCLTDDGGGGEIEWRPHGVPVIPGVTDRTTKRN